VKRAERIEKAKAVLAELEPKYNEARYELVRAERSFDPGERVRVTETCRRGCCIENSFVGVVVKQSEHSSAYYVVKSDSGKVDDSVYESDMVRL
jgi:hypothetical protein